jgi:tetratricopeptide (TPR) repeat protein
MPHRPLLQANACMPRSWKLQAAVSLPPIAALHPDRPDELAAGAAALRDGRVADAVAAYDRALERLSPDAQPEQRGTALLARGLAHQLLGDTSRATADVLSALNVWSLVRPGWASSAMSDLAAALSGAGNGAADAYWQAALRLAERSGDVVLQAAVSGEWGRHAARAGEAVTAVALLEKSAELGRRAGDDAIVAKALVNLARVELDAGRGGHAMRNIGEALARDQRGELRAATAGLLIDVAAGAFQAGDTAHAELCLEQALSLSGGGDRQICERTLAALGGLARARGDYAAAARYGEELLDSSRRGGDLTVAAEALHDLGRIALLAGALEDAAQRLTESVVIARSLGLDPLAASGSRALAEVAIQRGALLRALGYAEQAVILSMSQDDLEACAATLLLVGAEAGRARLDDVARPANEGAAEIYRLLERDDLARVLSGESPLASDGEARTDRLEAGLEAARSVVNPTRPNHER